MASRRSAEWQKANPERTAAIRKKAFAKYYAANREYNIARVTAYQKANPDRKRAADKRYYAAHRVLTAEQLARKRASWRRCYIRHREQNIARVIQYGKDRPEWMAERNRRRKALRRGAPSAERITLSKLFVRDRGRCHLCRKRVKRSDASMDHIIPVSLGGPHTWNNVALAHLRRSETCPGNAGKGNRAANDQLRLI